MKPILVSGIQPSGRLHIGNYLGALRNFVELQNSGKYQCYFFVADLHSLTENYTPTEKTEQILNLTADFIAAGVDPKKSVIFLQSQVPAHSELAWVLNTITPMGELERMTQFKDKTEKDRNKFVSEVAQILDKSTDEEKLNINNAFLSKDLEGLLILLTKYISNQATIMSNVGLFDYPVLMAADIILYDAKFVPVGDDQLQHLELTRTLARKFNSRFGDTFIEPQPLLTKAARVMSLGNPEKKMSKSQPETCLFIDDEPEIIKQKVMRAVTDCGSEIKYDRTTKPGISNLLDLHSAISGTPILHLEKQFADKRYSDLKTEVANLVTTHFEKFRKNKKELLKKKLSLKKILTAGSKKASLRASRKMVEVKKKIGLI